MLSSISFSVLCSWHWNIIYKFCVNCVTTTMSLCWGLPSAVIHFTLHKTFQILFFFGLFNVFFFHFRSILHISESKKLECDVERNYTYIVVLRYTFPECVRNTIKYGWHIIVGKRTYYKMSNILLVWCMVSNHERGRKEHENIFQAKKYNNE